MKNDLSYHNLSVKDATKLALDRPLWRFIDSKWSYALNWSKASRMMMMMMMMMMMRYCAGMCGKRVGVRQLTLMELIV